MTRRHAAPRRTYRVTFLNQGKVYEIYARNVAHGEMFGFIEVSDIVFGERSQVVVDPSEESLKHEFSGSRGRSSRSTPSCGSTRYRKKARRASASYPRPAASRRSPRRSTRLVATKAETLRIET
jgi:Domain of unknown function (DUF1820)